MDFTPAGVFGTIIDIAAPVANATPARSHPDRPSRAGRATGTPPHQVLGERRLMSTTQRKKRHLVAARVASDTPDNQLTTFTSDLLTPEEERELLTHFWDVKSELVRVLIRHFPKLR